MEKVNWTPEQKQAIEEKDANILVAAAARKWKNSSISRKNNKQIALRGCWDFTGGKNCCHCEKCYRTMLALFAEGEDPQKYGFEYTRKNLKKIKYCQDKRFSYKKYGEIQSTMRKNCHINDLPREIRWFYKTDIRKLGSNKIYKILIKIKRKVKRIFKLLLEK